MLDLVLSPEWQYRYYSFDASWTTETQVGSMRNGGGDWWFCWFGTAGAAIVGLAHESPMNPASGSRPSGSITTGMPTALRAPVLNEPAFTAAEASFVLWREPHDDRWRTGDLQLPDAADPDGAEDLLNLVARDTPSDYVRWASSYFFDDERAPDSSAVEAIWNGETLSVSLIQRLNDQADIDTAFAEATRTGYPVSAPVPRKRRDPRIFKRRDAS